MLAKGYGVAKKGKIQKIVLFFTGGCRLNCLKFFRRE